MENKKDEAIRYNKGKPRLGLIPLEYMSDMANALEYGATKYNMTNWQKGQKVSSILDSCMRHLAKLQLGEAIDEESGVHHVGLAMTNLMFIAYNLKHKPENNDLNIK